MQLHRTSKIPGNPEHFAVTHNAMGQVLVQLGDAYGGQVRLALAIPDAAHLAQLLRAEVRDAIAFARAERG